MYVCVPFLFVKTKNGSPQIACWVNFLHCFILLDVLKKTTKAQPKVRMRTYMLIACASLILPGFFLASFLQRKRWRLDSESDNWEVKVKVNNHQRYLRSWFCAIQFFFAWTNLFFLPNRCNDLMYMDVSDKQMSKFLSHPSNMKRWKLQVPSMSVETWWTCKDCKATYCI